MKLIDEYKKAKQAIFDHVGFKESNVVCPIDDCTDMFWSIIKDNLVKYADTMEQFNSNGNYYEDEIYTQRFYPRWVYEGEKFTMIFCDPHFDGMEWFRIFDNNKRIK